MTVFLDTNVLVYAALSDDPRCAIAERLLAAGGAISVQVLNEFANVARAKLKWSWPDIEAMLALVRNRSGRVQPIAMSTHEAALAFARDHNVSFYDALIVAAAVEAGCDTVLTEDMQHGRKFGGLTIVNPFIESAP
ncbi:MULTISPECIES: PIN domain-containing protein [unclassified Bradyrhizobium]|uniref:PIN domain-containing protein n=1 Tax=unclassified Bradyrhizobium TaxID=2631580 RepID=UPI00211DB08C|nr:MULTISPECIES: PIN domain-containing protein [unclassified Bradyrhizobium]MDD1536578.1 VapC toxin family PIN domain ribonuclease [Bradyrhizobium sp. WBOS8]MDD1586336.1 VapC toxin family PIN domain ribonuclease [Bradyrhizobium sp. WBOS4]UUO45951.1 VapC toxin family PIN domain ribonuclease [Bradyrhizobium sp. WBOS04]UUO59655.1 VapC toxin family PIN domain ribonuclease [Bradyrhizobium sp. WBOS08]